MAMTKTRDYVSVQPSLEPITVEDARLHLDLDDNYYDSQLSQLITVARKRVEQDSRRSLVSQTHVLSMDIFPSSGVIELPTAPVISVTSVTYVDTNDAVQTFSDTKYSVDSNNTPSRIVINDGEDFPTVRGHYDDIKITYVAGYGTSRNDVDEVAKFAIKMMISHLFNSPSITAHGTVNVVPLGYDSLVRSLAWGQYP
ncbi:MAG: phage head-tail connector protein [Planctomycetes bacterium]|nr:phage head-tail connector protein [Planctomycetota bacterium]